MIINKKIIFLSCVGIFILSLGGFFFLPPWPIAMVTSKPATDYQQAFQAVQQLKKTDDNPEIDPLCKTQLLTHNAKVEKVIVFYHGFTNCPKQFQQLGELFFQAGYNVFIPRLPRHGLLDKMTTDMENLTAHELAEFTQYSIDISQGLGDKTTIAGLSAGGVAAAWGAQNSTGVDLAVLIAPSFESNWREIYTPAITRIGSLAPNFFIWWDSKVKEKVISTPYAYPRYSTHALAEVYRLGLTTKFQANYKPAAAKSILIVTNANDTGVNNDSIKGLGKRWGAKGTDVKYFEFEKNIGLLHDLIDPTHPKQNTEFVYPKLLEIIESSQK